MSKRSTSGVHDSLEGQCGHFLPLISFEASWSQMLYCFWLLGRLNEVNLNRKIILGKVLFYFWRWNEWRGQSTYTSCSLSCVWLFVTSWTAACQASLSFTISQSLLKLMSIELMMPPNHFILCRPLLLLPSIFPSIRVFSNELTLHIRWPKYWSHSFSSKNMPVESILEVKISEIEESYRWYT